MQIEPALNYLPKVLVIEDDLEVRRTLRASLPARDYRLHEATTATDGLALAEALAPDLILIDLVLPDMDGLDVIRHMRLRRYRIPIIVLSVETDEFHKIIAFDAGADDFVSKPFAIGELLARLRAALRRAFVSPSDSGAGVFRASDIEVDFELRRVRVAGKDVHLTPIEYSLLQLLTRHADHVLTHSHLLREVWGTKNKAGAHYVRVYMAQLRRKLEADPARPRHLQTETGIGYRFHTES